jgi:NADPH:quinone reductase-like Zn-dependent oxidoreductase
MIMHRVLEFDVVGNGHGLLLRAVPIPTPGTYEVLFKVYAFGLNQADLLLMEGRHYVTSELPMRIGYEASGEVIAVGASVTRFNLGDRVTCIPNVDGPYSVAGEFALAREEFLTAWPDGYSAIEAAGFWMQYLTAYFPMKELFPIAHGDWVLITAASGGTGLGAICMARLLGARVIATSRTPLKRELLLNHGAEEVVLTDTLDLAGEIKRITGGTGVRLICDSMGGPFVARLIEALADRGIIYVHGGLSGSNQLSFPVLPLVQRGAGIFGFSLINELRKPVSMQRGRDFVLEAIARGGLHAPTIDQIFPFSRTSEAYARMRSGAQRGKIIVSLQSASHE